MLWHGSNVSPCHRIWFWEENGGRFCLTSLLPVSVWCPWTDSSILSLLCFPSQDEILEGAAHLSQLSHPGPLPPLNGHRIKKRVISRIPKWFFMLISHVSVLAILKCSCFLRSLLDDLCFPDFGMFTLAVLSWQWFIHASLSCQLLSKNIECQEG